VALSVAGDQALRVWGKQWVKVLQMIDKRMEESCPTIIGEAGVGGTARRVRVKAEIKKMFS
jgi:nucleoporin GLE1